MIGAVTQENIRSIIPAKAARVASIFSERKNVPPLQALIDFYETDIYKALEREESKVWWQSAEEIERDWEDSLR